MELCIEEVKGLNLVDFLTRHYGLRFHRVGKQFVCHSPFSQEATPSFFVRLVDGRWLFKDFSSGFGGSIFDFVQIKEGLGNFKEALDHDRGGYGAFHDLGERYPDKRIEPYDLKGTKIPMSC